MSTTEKNSDIRLQEAILSSAPDKAMGKLFQEGLRRGQKVAVFQDPTYGMDGTVGTIESESQDGGWMNVRFEGGATMPILSYFLIPLD